VCATRSDDRRSIASVRTIAWVDCAGTREALVIGCSRSGIRSGIAWGGGTAELRERDHDGRGMLVDTRIRACD
jgi:hypothetical protein